MTIATEAQKRGACPQCGAKLPDVPVSLCPYCASPLETKADREARASVHTARIGRIKDHKDAAEAFAWTPPEGARFQAGRRTIWWGSRSAIGGAALTLGGALAGGSRWAMQPMTWVGLTLAAAGVVFWWRGRQRCMETLRLPLLRRPALILDRRSVTDLRGWAGTTTYFFKLEFEDGAQGEFAFPGLGPQEEPYATNLPGIAFTRGQDLLYFRHIRV